MAAANEPAQPAITGLRPGSLNEGAGEQWIAVFGSNFSMLAGKTSVAYWSGAPREMVVQDAGTIKMFLRAEGLGADGANNVVIFTPGADPSLPRTFRVLPAGQNPVAQVTAVSINYSGGPTLVVSGNDIVNGAEVRINGVAKPTTRVNEYVLSAAVGYGDLQKGGTCASSTRRRTTPIPMCLRLSRLCSCRS